MKPFVMEGQCLFNRCPRTNLERDRIVALITTRRDELPPTGEFLTRRRELDVILSLIEPLPQWIA